MVYGREDGSCIWELRQKQRSGWIQDLENKFDTGLDIGNEGVSKMITPRFGGCITSLISVPFRAMKYH